MKRPAPLVIVGDSLLDRDVSGRAERLAPDAPVPVVGDVERRTRPGGAALAACLAAAGGREITFVTALGDDEASHAVRDMLKDRVHLVELPLSGSLSRKTRLMADGRPLLRLDEGDGRAAGSTPGAERALADAGAVLVADYGRGTADVLREALTARAARGPVVWDPHPAGGPPVPGTRLATPAAPEARHFAGQPAPKSQGEGRARPQDRRDVLRAATANARTLLERWGIASVAVTLGENGALLSQGGPPLLVPAPWRASGDCCGAGDSFAVAVAGRLADGDLVELAVREAVEAAARFVSDGGAHAVLRDAGPVTPTPGADGGARALVRRVRERGGTVVAAGGCFDLLHAGHVELLQAARRAGDCLVVCVNSDTSVRRRKGGGRPVVPAGDRARVLEALDCVDAVIVFDEDTPERLLDELRPDIWAKGGDYALTDLPETALVESWGGQVVLLPYLDGRSSTRLVERAARRPGAPSSAPTRR
ncbi:D-glycero-beta-D-manno-heptose 1-phosphate adenylyltransferase [Streptomyces sp. A0958]|uniref:D-glycero-beta-D-manno-heptose 1-phosphate adenylyltransferase n=1 Tax=Streptomyces sp. A0958 TaxID=2563101 RepID=UPI00109E7064|nr:D-glycero-beta-D-manno-heptose 1-phosphate adenylyltransferase [Streptomyces sp. A0958]THA71180.1 D-glycero-beta-D-manno-heptose 1-phosphate adenylyltransferase [Streptomyces sp. A0958]